MLKNQELRRDTGT